MGWCTAVETRECKLTCLWLLLYHGVSNGGRPSPCESCAAGVYHIGDTPCSGHGRCSGSGTTGGTGECLCFTEWMGEECDVSVAAVAGGGLGGLTVLACICVLVLFQHPLRRICSLFCCCCFCRTRGATVAGAAAPLLAGGYVVLHGGGAVRRINGAGAAHGTQEQTDGQHADCAVCWAAPSDTAFSCGHMLCGDCAAAVQVCPTCRTPVTQRIRIYR